VVLILKSKVEDLVSWFCTVVLCTSLLLAINTEGIVVSDGIFMLHVQEQQKFVEAEEDFSKI